jgi:two-component sensor histidine kinase
MVSYPQDCRTDDFRHQVAGRFGVLPNFFCSAPAAVGLMEELWAFAKSAYLDSPLPSLFKERLFVHLSRFCEVRYCIVRHVGFLIGKGRPAGDANVQPETVSDVVALLSRPVPNGAELAASLSRMKATLHSPRIPEPRSPAEADLFDALTVIFLEPRRADEARQAVRAAVGESVFEILIAYLSFIRTAHYWTENHSHLAYEPDMVQVIAERPVLARLMLDTSEAESARASAQLRRALDDLNRTQGELQESESRLKVLVAELQHRTRNLLSVVRAMADRTMLRSRDLTDFRNSFRSRLDALARVQRLLSRLDDDHGVTFDELVRTELAAHGVEDGKADRVRVQGPTGIRLSASMVQMLAMALHELTTNAIKYGALGAPGGFLNIEWQLKSEEGAQAWLHIDWQERGISVSPALKSEQGSGQGRELIERALPYELDARATFVLGADGVHCTIALPMSRINVKDVVGSAK